MVIQMVVLGILLLIVPAIVGTIFVEKEYGTQKVLLGWVSGQVTLWAAFLVVSVPLILLKKTFSMVTAVYSGLIAVLILVAIVVAVWRRKKGVCGQAEREKLAKSRIGLWGVFGVLLLVQLVLSVLLAYEEGDDAFYVAISTTTESSNRMYQTLPYTGATTGLDARHGLAPFPVWAAYLARVSGMVPVTVAQLVVPLQIILLTYAIYYLIAGRLFEENKKNIPLFMILVEIMFLFGGYSVYSAENFLLVRASQGKAVLANVILPFLFYLMFLLAEKMQNETNFGLRNWLLLGVTMLAGCLCSTLSVLLTCMLVGVIGICMAVCYKRWNVLVPLALNCVIPGLLAVLYFTISSV